MPRTRVLTAMNPDESHLYLLSLLAQGHSVDEILDANPQFDAADVAAAANAGLAALECPRIETRAERIARLQRTHPRAYAPWTTDEDARLLGRWREGARLAPLARELGRQPNAVRARLERHLGAGWREQRAPAPETA